MRTLLFSALLLTYGCQQPNTAPAPAPKSPAPLAEAQSLDTTVSLTAINKPVPTSAATFAEALEAFRIQDPTGIRFRGCYYTQLPFPKKEWPQHSEKRRKVNRIYTPGSKDTLHLTEDLLFIYEMHPGQYLIVEEYDQFYHYVELTLVDDNLQVIWGPEDVNCQAGEYGDGIQYTVFTATNQLSTLREELVEIVGPDSILYRKSLTTTTFTEEQAPGSEWEHTSYYYRIINSVTEPTLHIPEGGMELSDQLAWPVDSFLPDNSIGLAYLTGATDTTYRFELRFPFYQRGLIERLLQKHHYPTLTGGEAYYNDVHLPVSPFKMTLFDTSGTVLELDTLSQLRYHFYCENDGPIIHNPTFDLTVPKANFPGEPTSLLADTYSSITGAAIINYDPASMPELTGVNDNFPTWAEQAMALPTAGQPLLMIHTAEDEASEDIRCWYLSIAGIKSSIEVNCCGP